MQQILDPSKLKEFADNNFKLQTKAEMKLLKDFNPLPTSRF